MSYIGSTPQTQAFTPAVDYFNGTGSTTSFTLSRPVASVAQIQVVVDNVPQNPSSAYTVSGNTITFTSAPLSGTNNIYVEYTSPITQVNALSQSPVVYGNLNFGSTGARIQGDFSNATATNRVIFQTSTTNGNTGVIFIPNGTGTTTSLELYNNSDLTANPSSLLLSPNATEARLISSRLGTGSFLPMTFYTGGSERMRIDTSGNVGIGTSSPISGANVSLTANGAIAVSSGLTADQTSRGIIDYNNGAQRFISYGPVGTFGNFIWFSGTGGSSPTERMRIDSSGNVGIGTSSPNISSATTKALTIASASGQDDAMIEMTQGSTIYGRLYSNGNGLGITGTGGIGLRFYTASTFASAAERMRIDSGGRLYVNQTAGNGNTLQRMGLTYDGSSEWGLSFKNSWSGNAGSAINFNNYAGTQVGTIQPGATSTSYNTSSDYRLKENVQPMVGALNIVTQLKPVTYNWIADGSQGQGFIAHELQAVVPDCVTGEKDAVDEEGNPVYQGIDTSFLVATLTAAIQEQQVQIAEQSATIKQLQADVAALKGK